MKTTHYIYAMGESNFLKQSVKQMRKSIKGIDDSYNHPWDIIAELTQNSVDAVKKRIQKKEIEKGAITIKIDSRNNFISVEDNGVGIHPDKLEVLVAPFSTDKEEDPNSIGEKGVGLTFTVFSCNQFYIKSGTEKGVSDGKINDAFKWKSQTDETPLILFTNPLKENYRGTLVELSHVKESVIFDLSVAQLKAVLRTKTALGNTLTIWGDDVAIDIKLIVTNIDGIEYSEKIDFSYLLITEGRLKSTLMDIEDWYVYAKAGRTDMEKMKKMYNKVVFKQGTWVYGERIVKYWACCASVRKFFNEVSVKNGICTEDQLKNDDFMEYKGFTLFNSAITVSVKGMPTGITIEHPVTGNQGAWPQMFMLFEDPFIKFDIGRKAIHGMQAKIYKNIAKEIFNEFVGNVVRYMGDADDKYKPEWDKAEIFRAIEGLPSMNIDAIKLQKKPIDQEASVVGLFYECIGNKMIKNILPLSSGYKRQYDLYAKWDNRDVIIEFKTKARDIIEDFINERKYFDRLDCLVCWKVTGEDYEAFQKAGLTFEEIEEKEFVRNQDATVFPHATHQLILPYTTPKYVIDLSIIIGV